MSSYRPPRSARFADHVTICSPIKDEEPFHSDEQMEGKSWEEDPDDRRPSDDVPVLVPNSKWHDVEEADENENFRLNRERLRNLLLADPVLQEKAQHFIENVLQNAQERVGAREHGSSFEQQEAQTTNNQPVSLQKLQPGQKTLDQPQQQPTQPRQWAREALPSLEAVNRTMSGFFSGVSRAFQRFAATSENFIKNRRQQNQPPSN